MKGVEFLEDKVTREDILLIHFAASPFIEEPIITDAIRVCREMPSPPRISSCFPERR